MALVQFDKKESFSSETKLYFTTYFSEVLNAMSKLKLYRNYISYSYRLRNSTYEVAMGRTIAVSINVINTTANIMSLQN